jgi:hypothetical protein
MLSTPVLATSAFLRPTDDLHVITSLSVSRFDKRFDARGRLVEAGRFTKALQETSVDYGLTNRISLTGMLSRESWRPDIITAFDVNQSAAAGLAGGRIALFQADNISFAAQGLAGIRSSSERQRFIHDLRLMAGHGFDILGTSAFIEVQFGRRADRDDGRAEWRLDTTFGLKPAENLLVLAQAFAAASPRQGPRPAEQRLKAQASLVWTGSSFFSLQASAFTTVAGRNTGRETGAVLALWFRY